MNACFRSVLVRGIPCLLAVLAASGCSSGGGPIPMFEPERDETGRWTVASANQWYSAQPWSVGCNFIPSTAVNQLEMWQQDTFDPETIDRELGWAADLGFNTARVFLHDILWETDSAGLIARMNAFLEIADSHGIRTMFVLFDNVWGPTSAAGPQPEPKPGVHNSGWVQSPQLQETVDFPNSPEIRTRLEKYVRGVIREFGSDPRILMWDLVNEPGNSLLMDQARPLVESSFAWARLELPKQPLTAGVWMMPTTWELSLFQIEQSDVVTFHSYDAVEYLTPLIDGLRTLTERPMICTEYMARTLNSRFETHMPVFSDSDIGAINWGLVSGRTQTIFPWTSKQGDPEPEVWFHDIFRTDGTPFDPAEVEFITNFIAGRGDGR